jgi:ferrochelatase
MGTRVGVKKTAVVLLNLGGPSSLEEVKPFLFSLFSDPAILTLPNPFRFILATLITKRRLKEARHIYSLLGGKSPLLPNTQAQAQALKKELGLDYTVFVAMRHAPPLSSETFEKVKAYDPDEIVLLPLYPQYSKTTTKSSFRAWEKASEGCTVPTRFIKSYATESGFLEALKERVLPSYQEAQRQGSPKLLLTAHGLPEKFIRNGDPYQQQVEQTAQALLETLGLSGVDSTLCYQSRVGPLKWIGPYTEDEVRKASRERRPLVVVPLSFVSEHSETLVELDMTYRDLALREGCPAYYRVDTVQTHPAFIKGLASLVRNDP